MAHFARLSEDNVVLAIHVVNNNDVNNLPFPESEPIGVTFLTGVHGYPLWKQTSYNANFRKNYAGESFTYDADLDAFIPPKPYPSWFLDMDTCQWVPPIPRPTDGKVYYWDEATLSWQLVDPQPSVD